MTRTRSSLRDRLRRDLVNALKTGDRELVSVLRTVIGALENAEAVPPRSDVTARVAMSEHVAGSTPGIGAAEVPRRQITRAEEDRLVMDEVAELASLALEHERAGRPGQALAARQAAELLRALVDRARRV